MDEFNIQYQGFSPSEFAKTYIRQLMNKVHDEAPSSSTLRVTISKTGQNLFKGFVRISSSAGPFFVMASSDKLTELAHQLLERTRRQLDKWKTRRFSHETLRDSLARMAEAGERPRKRYFYRGKYDDNKQAN